MTTILAILGAAMIDVEGNRLLVGLAPADVMRFRQGLTLRRHAAGTMILAADDRSTELHLVLSGRVAVRSYSDDGSEVAYAEIPEGSFFGELSAIDGLGRSADVVAMTDVTVSAMRAEIFRSALASCPALGLNLAIHLAGKVRSLSNRVFEFSTLPSSVRIRREILRLASEVAAARPVVMIRPAPTHYEIAARTATHREAVSRELAALATRRVLRTGRQMIEITDMATLKSLAAI